MRRINASVEKRTGRKTKKLPSIASLSMKSQSQKVSRCRLSVRTGVELMLLKQRRRPSPRSVGVVPAAARLPLELRRRSRHPPTTA